MERKIVERRTVLKGGAAAVGMLGSGASASMVAGVQQASADTPPSSVPDQILAAFQRFRETIPANFDHEYVEKAVRPFFLTSFYEGERPMLPVIDVTFSKENALPFDLWGLITRDWRPTPEDGVTVFLQGLEKRGPNNLRKRIYFSGVTPDLYKPMYGPKVVAFFDKLMDKQFANKPSFDDDGLEEPAQKGRQVTDNLGVRKGRQGAGLPRRPGRWRAGAGYQQEGNERHVSRDEDVRNWAARDTRGQQRVGLLIERPFTSAVVQVFGRRNDGLSTHSDGRRPKSVKAGNRGLGTAVVPQLWGFRRGRRRRCGGTRRQGTQFCHAAWA